MWMRRVATGLLAGYQRHAAAAAAAGGARPPAQPAAVAALQQACSFSSRKFERAGGAEPQPFRVAVQQVEAALLDPQLPPPVLADNQKVVAVMRQFVKNLEPPGGGWPPPFRHPRVTMVFRDHQAGGQLQPVTFHFTTTGGDCQGAVKTRWSQLLQRMGLNPNFYFDGEQFKPPPPPRRSVVEPTQHRRSAAPAPPPSPAEVESVRARAAAAGFPSQTITEEQFKEMQEQSDAGRAQRAAEQDELSKALQDVEANDKLLQAVAAVPWLMAEGERQDIEKAKLVQSRVVDKIEADGYDVRGAARRIWQGQRDLQLLTIGKDVGTALAIKQILFHATVYDRKMGKQTYLPK
ncbi:T-cell activation mitochondrial [Chlorella sorokiniana]|uniref:T-cell activation mitochondrial n=1 Tax=Chlorella sorokiniana TaxID=3076 RepID=A0A2P6TW17_CHLSO|nr:T-cell activation mitochondrial [Chlorella sorokiniana]|eukprot:PRW58250.1 T-cell activation mitochondrial [Chlorella sorokiniana]